MTFRFVASSYVINAPDVVAEDFDGQVVILNLANGHYFSLEGIAGRIWSLVLDGIPPDRILASIAAGRPDLAETAAAFLNQLVDHGLVVPGQAGDGAADFIADWAGEAPRLAVYDDLAELIFADPIHDVDEQAGWPVPRQTP